MDLTTIAQGLSVWFLPVIVAITFHEAAHGWMAERCGDDTARRLGRVSFNPIKHIDVFGTLVLPALLLLLKAPFLFGYAKPVPVNFRRLNHPKRDMIWVALAGPGVNVLLAFAAASVLSMIPITPGGLGFVEAGLTATLVAAGIDADAAVAATLLFRLVSFWIPLPIGAAAGWWFRRRYPRRVLA